jgi:micrococcal nuclease
MHLRRALVAIAVLAALFGAYRLGHRTTARPSPTSYDSSSAAPIPDGEARLVRVVDGDTVILHIGQYDERVRLIGIDTPETVKPDTPVQCWGPQASAHLKHLLPPGTLVRIARDEVPRDKYGRLLLYIWRASDGLFVDLEIAQDGWGRALTIPPNVAHESQIASAVAHAQSHQEGLWGHCPPTPQ